MIRGEHQRDAGGYSGMAVPFPEEMTGVSAVAFHQLSEHLLCADYSQIPGPYPALRVQQGPCDPKADGQIQQEKGSKVGRPGRVLQESNLWIWF